jgi:c(7)-type cytochrome triheme protein
MTRTITVLIVVLLLFSCKWSTAEKKNVEAEEAPVISSLEKSGLPCFKCHRYETFASDGQGRFPHQKHIGFGVHCNQCHIIKPHNEIALNKDTCDSCHKMATISFANTPLRVTFSHRNHANKFSCDECHPGLFQMKKGSSRITMNEMYTGKLCGKCHNGKTAFSSKDCSKCHNMSALKKDLSYPSGDMTPAVFSHQVHTAMFECGNCHTAVFKYKKGGSGMKMDDIYQNKFCGKCHNGQTAFGSSECQRCHK